MRGSLISFFNFTIALYNVKYTKYTTKVQQNSIKKEKKDKVLRRNYKQGCKKGVIYPNIRQFVTLQKCIKCLENKYNCGYKSLVCLENSGGEQFLEKTKIRKKAIDKVFFRWYPNRALCKRAKTKAKCKTAKEP